MKSKSSFEQHRTELHDNFIQQQASNLFGKPKEFWRHLKSDEEKANLFAEYFESVYVNDEEDSELDSFITNRNDVNYHNFTITDYHVKSVLHRMDVNKGSGFDVVASTFLREWNYILNIIAIHVLPECIAKLVN